MQISFPLALASLGPNAAFQLMNSARPPADYLFSQFLPERPVPTYNVESASMTIRPLMAGLVGMDSPYPETGAMETSEFLAQSAKIANRVDFPEAAARTLLDLVMRLQISGGNSTEAIAREVLNFEQTLLVQPHLDTAEWLRGQALLGSIDWTYNVKRLLVDYGIPAANRPAQRTGTSGYGGSASVFWTDNALALTLLRYDRRVVVMHPTTFNAIISNLANNIVVTAASGVPGLGKYSVIRMVQQNGQSVQSQDFRDRMEIVTYGREAEILDPASTTGATIRIPFIKSGKVLHLGNQIGKGYVVGAGSVAAPADYVLGYTHIAPTVEGGGAVGRWARIFTPEGRPWALVGEAAANLLPVVESPDKIVVFDTVVP